MSTTPPTVVLVHGALHGAWCWWKVVPGLESQGIGCVAVDLPRTSAFPGTSAWTGTVAAHLRAVVDKIDGPVVLCGHSAGGLAISAVGDHPGVRHLVYLAAVMPDADEVLAVAMGAAAAPPSELATAVVAGATGVTMDPDAGPRVFYSGCSADDVRHALGQVEAEPLPEMGPEAMTATLGTAPWRDRATTYVVCTHDRAMAVPAQRELAGRAGRAVEWPVGHSPFISHPHLVVDLLAGLARDGAPVAANAELRRRRRRVLVPPPDAVAKVHRRGLLTARERIELLLDPGSEWGFGTAIERDALLFGLGTVHGRPVAFKTQDTTFKGGAQGSAAKRAEEAAYHLADNIALPLFYLTQSAGGVIGPTVLSSLWASFFGGLAAARLATPRRGAIFTAVLGDAYAPWTAAVADVSVMTKAANMAFVSPFVVGQATGTVVGIEEVGGSEVQSKLTGQIDRVAEDEAGAIELLRTVFGYLPGNVFEPPPVVRTGDPVDRRSEALRTLVPPYPNKPYDVRLVVGEVVDRGSFLELLPEFGRSMVSGLARLDGRTVAILANQPNHQAGAVTVDGLTKARRLLRLADTFGLPLVTFIDNPGAFTTIEEEHRRLLSVTTDYCVEAVVRTEVPRVMVVIGKGFGIGYHIMAGTHPEGITLSWPNAQMAYMGPEGGVWVAHRREVAASDEPRALVEQLAAPYRTAMNPWLAARSAGVDDIIDPADTRPLTIKALDMLDTRRRRRWRDAS